ncbi:hypothetical protein BY996DRAFT_8686059 [Phakopsora pachyrhizi]|nr:hypothetical protein BY996DRAFT_8686059 [Phakopsora pachyrhizi]
MLRGLRGFNQFATKLGALYKQSRSSLSEISIGDILRYPSYSVVVLSVSSKIHKGKKGVLASGLIELLEAASVALLCIWASGTSKRKSLRLYIASRVKRQSGGSYCAAAAAAQVASYMELWVLH